MNALGTTRNVDGEVVVTQVEFAAELGSSGVRDAEVLVQLFREAGVPNVPLGTAPHG